MHTQVKMEVAVLIQMRVKVSHRLSDLPFHRHLFAKT